MWSKGKTCGELLKEHEFGIGCNATRPYCHKTITQHADAIRWFYEEFPATRGKGEGQNPAYAKVVKDTLHFIGLVLGHARTVLPDAMEPWMVQRIVGTLRADCVRDSTVALMLAHGMTLGERPSTWWIRNHGHLSLSGRGLEVWRAYTKSDKQQARTRARCSVDCAGGAGGRWKRDVRFRARASRARLRGACVPAARCARV